LCSLFVYNFYFISALTPLEGGGGPLVALPPFVTKHKTNKNNATAVHFRALKEKTRAQLRSTRTILACSRVSGQTANSSAQVFGRAAARRRRRSAAAAAFAETNAKRSKRAKNTRSVLYTATWLSDLKL
jgi:hypothetical protein